MDAFVILFLIILIVCWACYERSLSKAVYGIAAIELFLRIVYFIKTNIGLNSFSEFLGYLPSNLLNGIIDKYTAGFINIILSWLFLLIMILFLFYTAKSFIKTK